ncbi:MAG TPA: VOC family protein, partial [bacterium]|nr:VOC family protein [bacterium]
IGIVTQNLDKMLQFYTKLLKIEIISKNEEKGEYIDKLLGLKNGNIITIKLGKENKILLELLYFNNPVSEKTQNKKCYQTGLTHISFDVEDIETLFNNFIKKNTTYISQPIINPDKTAKVMFCNDPDGNLLELVELIKK